MDDARDEKNYVFNIVLAKLAGLYQMLDPGTARFRGRNLYQVFVAFFVLYAVVGATALVAGSLYYWTDNTSITVWYVWSTTNSLYSCYKMWIVVYRSDDIWNCLSITRYGFTSSSVRKGNGAGQSVLLDRWRARSVWYTSLLSSAYCLSLVLYVGCLLAFSDATIPIKNRDGSVGDYRPNVLNLFFLTSDETYNEYYNAFFVVEALFVATITMFYLQFDLLLLTLCLAICCQMQIICAAFESVNHKNIPLNDHPHSSAIGNTDEKQILSNEHDLIYDELITIIINHQAVTKKYNEFVNTLERVMLLHIFVSSISLIIIWFNFIMSFSDGGTFETSGATTVKTIVAIPSFSFQIFMTCYLFENVHNQKDLITFALYSSNWTEMNMKSKKLILLTIQMNNANQKKLRFTRTRIVNLEMFFKTMGHCYTVISVLINYINAKNN